MIDNELQHILRRIGPSHRVVAKMAELRDERAKAGDHALADLWGYLAAEMAELRDLEAREWRDFLRTSGIGFLHPPAADQEES